MIKKQAMTAHGSANITSPRKPKIQANKIVATMPIISRHIICFFNDFGTFAVFFISR